jgi:hypothetical protein
MCEQKKLKKIMGYIHDWNDEIIAQFYDTMRDHGQRLVAHEFDDWGTWYNVSYVDFPSLLGFGRSNSNHPKIHNKGTLPT